MEKRLQKERQVPIKELRRTRFSKKSHQKKNKMSLNQLKTQKRALIQKRERIRDRPSLRENPEIDKCVPLIQ